MPYITEPRRNDILGGKEPLTPRELNYTLTVVCQRFLDTRGKTEDSHYSTLSEIVVQLECAKLEFYRRILAIKENGDVY